VATPLAASELMTTPPAQAGIPRNQHPVWNVYNEFRTARFSAKYYVARLRRFERINFWLEITLALTASGSGVAALSFWQTGYGKTVWTWLTAISATVAVAKPFLKLTERVKDFEGIAAGYSSLEHAYQNLTIRINQAHAYSPSLQNQFQVLYDRGSDLKSKEIVDRVPKRRLMAKCRKEVDAELPEDRFYVPR
jgi:hypothetical protein